MAALGKGTRVKLIKEGPNKKVPIGAIGTILDIRKPSSTDSTPKYLWILFDNFKSNDVTNCYACLPEYIKPIYDGDEKSSWNECAWKPLNVSLPT